MLIRHVVDANVRVMEAMASAFGQVRPPAGAEMVDAKELLKAIQGGGGGVGPGMDKMTFILSMLSQLLGGNGEGLKNIASFLQGAFKGGGGGPADADAEPTVGGAS